MQRRPGPTRSAALSTCLELAATPQFAVTEPVGDCFHPRESGPRDYDSGESRGRTPLRLDRRFRPLSTHAGWRRVKAVDGAGYFHDPHGGTNRPARCKDHPYDSDQDRSAGGDKNRPAQHFCLGSPATWHGTARDLFFCRVSWKNIQAQHKKQKHSYGVIKIVAAEEEPVPVPVSPIAQYFNSSVLSIVVIGVLETEVPIDDSQTIPLLKNMLLPINPRFSSIMVDTNGVKQWKKVEVQLKDHVKVPIFPAEMTPEFYEKCQHDYISKIGIEPLSQHRPLWEIHLFKYPTCNAAGTIIFKLHHVLGDGFSLIGALLSCLQRADDPSLPVTFPSVTTQPIISSENGDNGLIRNVPEIVSLIFNSATDFFQSLKSSLVKNRQTPIRSGSIEVGYGPVSISTIRGVRRVERLDSSGEKLWLFEQLLEQVVFVTASCPYQVRNLQVRHEYMICNMLFGWVLHFIVNPKQD
ncbi:uncharacterized protein LOC116113322 [Pistacia vera]|uniref:uncharacterized protein LOC116113322 n=1 Tax=Pistacia vera TaxID=55513 RepID=UPI0012635A5D|nr:uncharacterized protein LOC116113322 [Pistacia vera]